MKKYLLLFTFLNFILTTISVLIECNNVTIKEFKGDFPESDKVQLGNDYEVFYTFYILF